MSASEFWGFVSTFIMLWVANMAGVGGAGLFIPIGILLLKFDVKNCIALSNFSIFLSSAQRYLLNLNSPHPLKNGRGLIVEYNIGVIMLPGIVSGVSIGAMINELTPGLIVLIFFCLLVAYLGFGLFKKAK